ncbi:unnamed protein product [Adineta ricciae]|uniref:Uncharacterized protein n=1 Tax=Adineta ricciae TaxID=249248 RepID=A0A814WYC6_ADIRI|nr:unnamed protein product [Adineta ricciae]CAF1512546.1 unnamed protein product [Adineta ricciae]
MNQQMVSSSRVSHISNMFPSANIYEDEQYIANLINQHLALCSSGTSGKVKTIIKPVLTEDISLFNDTGFLANQLRRSEISYPYEYKTPANVKQNSGVTLRNTSMTMNDFNEEIPINVNHLRRQHRGGIRKRIKSISKVRVVDQYAEPIESAVQLDHRQQSALSHPITYRIPVHIQPTTGTISRTHYAITEEEPAQETSIHVAQLRQPLFAPMNAAKRSVSSIIAPSAFVDIPVIHETPIYVDRVRHLIQPQIVQYKPSKNILPSIGSLFQTRFALSQEESPEERAFYVNQLRQPTRKDPSNNEKGWVWV